MLKVYMLSEKETDGPRPPEIVEPSGGTGASAICKAIRSCSLSRHHESPGPLQTLMRFLGL